MTAPLTVRLEVLERAHAALEAVHRLRTGEPVPVPLAFQVAEALGNLKGTLHRIECMPIEVIEA